MRAIGVPALTKLSDGAMGISMPCAVKISGAKFGNTPGAVSGTVPGVTGGAARGAATAASFAAFACRRLQGARRIANTAQRREGH